ncbi:MAG TPA: lamin tail domain-containing protein, partial [Verrucomicrobiae bacterium]
ITNIEYSPASSNQAQEFVELRNTNSYAVDVSGWHISGAIDHRFAPGTVMAANSSLFITPDVKAFRARTTGPHGGQGLFVQGGYSGQLSARGETMRIQDPSGRLVAITNYPGNPSLAQQYLRVTELMYHPSPLSGNTNSPEEFGYVELKNIGAVALDLNGVRFTNGITFSFAGSAVTNLAPGQRVLVVKNSVQFALRYGGGLLIAGQYLGSLDNAGERLQLLDAVGEEILDFSYNNTWFRITDGLGFSLVVVDELAAPDSWNNKSNWRPSGAVLGSPGADDPPAPVFAPVLVNEVLTRTVGVPDSIELYNPNTNAVDLSGWFLTDDFSTPAKFRIPDGTIISGGDYRVFTESNFNATPGVPPSFALSSDGDETYLFGALTNGNLTGFYHGFDFGAAHEGVSFGRYVSSEGKEHFVAQQAVTLDATNGGPRVGPLVISEIMYHPLDIGTNDNTADEFIEVLNITANSVPLFDPAAPTNTWKITGGIDFVFPTNLTLAAGEAVLVLNFSPTNAALLAGFRTNFNVATNVHVFGPYSGALNNDSDEINLRQPILPSGGTNISYVLIEKVEYQDVSPWTQVADGFGYSLQRWDAQAFGNEPTNWVAARLTPGAPSITNGGPTFLTSQPQSQTWILGYNASISVTATGTPPFFAQWRRNGTNIPGATNFAFNVTNVQPHHAGQYQVTVGNDSAVVLSEIATVTVRSPIALLTQPQTIDVRIAPDPAAAPATNVTFVSSASSAAPIRYQWRRNGSNIPNGTNATLTIVNVQTNDLGFYSVRAEDADQLSFIESTNAWLYPLITPVFIEQPISQSVAIGTPVTFSAQIIGWPPPFTFEWRLGAATVSTAAGDQPFSFFTVTASTNVTTVSYRAVAKNRAFPSGRASNFGAVTTLADSDLNGLPDAWETAYGVTNPAADSDGDGMLNWQEYQAGTDPTNALSNLKINSMVWSNAALQFRFQAMSNKTYGIQYKTSLNPGTWLSLAEMVARRTNRVESINDTPLTNRFYRIVTPAP